jgi:hypothetical protein
MHRPWGRCKGILEYLTTTFNSSIADLTNKGENMKKSLPKSPVTFYEDNALFDQFMADINKRFKKTVSGTTVFQTAASGLWRAFINSFDTEAAKQYHNCNCCRHFIERFGGLVVVDDNGAIKSAVWDLYVTPQHYKKAVENMLDIIEDSEITSPFLSKEGIIGSPMTGEWSHFYLKLPKDFISSDRLRTPFQITSEKVQDFNTIRCAMIEYRKEIVDQAVSLLEGDNLYRSEKVLGPAKFLQGLLHLKNNKYKKNLIWKAVAEAPKGFCHPRSSMIGTLLDDLNSGAAFEDVSRRFAAKMKPTLYQRPQAAPTEGNIKRGEDIIKKLGLETALQRRFARVDEIPFFWTPKAAHKNKTEGVFGHLKPKHTPENVLNIPRKNITWVKFKDTVLPLATGIEVFISYDKMNFTAITTAAVEDSQPIFQYENEKNRNSFSSYCWNGGSFPAQFGLDSGWHKVEGIVNRPEFWGKFQPGNFKDNPIFILANAHETKTSAGNALFPETLRSDLHAIRSTIEAYSRLAKLSGEEESACGITIGDSVRLNVRVTSPGQVAEYTIDRID